MSARRPGSVPLRRLVPAALLLAAAWLVSGAAAAAQAPESPAVRRRVDALLARMTLEEKVGQMTQLTIGVVAAKGPHAPGRLALDSAKLHEALVRRHVGSLLNVGEEALSIDGWHSLIREVQRVAVTRTRLGIPVLYGIDFVHGANYLRGGTIFPHAVGMAATWDTALVRETAAVTGREAFASGLPWNFAPVLDVGRQPAWPRFYETFGEDPTVAARLGALQVAGIQQTGRVAATMKHYLGYGVPRSGRDRTPTLMSERELREVVLPPFRAAVAAGAKTVMVNSGEIDGVPVHASRYWLTDVLRGELGFRGVIVTDWSDIVFLHTRHRVAPTMRDAVRMAIEAGVDMSMTPEDYGFADELVALVKSGAVTERRVNESVRRILVLKAELGVLDSPNPPASPSSVIGAPVSRELARRAARESITLLKNGGGVLPLARGARVLLAGPAANSVTALHGGWTYTWQGADSSKYPAGVPTLVDAMRARSAALRVVGGRGWREPTDADIAEAVRAARESDVAVLALGENAYSEGVGDIDDLTLSPAQLRLAAAVQATGTPTVLVLVEGRPRIIRQVADSARAIVLAYWPGMEGADAIAGALYGEFNPGGRLPFTYPRAPNALLTYDHRVTDSLRANETASGFAPEFEFGHGLSYTTFSYRDLRLDRTVLAPGQRVTVQVTVTNGGSRAGAEPVLLFTRQRYGTLTPAVRRLRAFDRVELAPGESRTVTFTLRGEDLAHVGQALRPVLDPGAYDVMVGGLSATFAVAAPGVRAGRAGPRR